MIRQSSDHRFSNNRGESARKAKKRRDQSVSEDVFSTNQAFDGSARD